MIRTIIFISFSVLMFSRSLGQKSIRPADEETSSTTLDEHLIAMLDTIYHDDNHYRQQLKQIEAKYGLQSEEMRNHWQIIQAKDSLNLTKVRAILDERGWLGPAVVGNQGNETLFLVIQHADLEMQQKYLPMMRDAVKHGNAQGGRLALLEDRVALRQGGKQIYGSQILRDMKTGEYSILPLIDPDNVDKRRAEVGLGPLQEYIAVWGMTWDVEAYKKKHAESQSDTTK